MNRRSNVARLLGLTFALIGTAAWCHPVQQSATSSAPPRTTASPPATAAMESVDLPDGARLIVLPEPEGKQVAIEIMFRVGENDEGRLHGVNTLVTRAWASGSDNRSGALLRDDIARHGETIGTDVQPDYVELWSVCAPEEMERCVQTLLTNMVSVPLFERTAVNNARSEQLEAITLRDDDILTDVMDSLRSRAYGEIAYGVPVPGTETTVRAIRTDAVAPYYRRYFRPDRAVIVVAGPVTMLDARRLITSCIGAGGWDDAGMRSPAARFESAPPIPADLRDSVLPRRAPATYVAAGYLAPGIDPLADRSTRGSGAYAALLVLDAALGGGKSGRLFGLRDRPAVGQAPIGYEIHSVFAPTRAQSFWAAYVVGNQPPLEVRTRLLAALAALGDGTQPITDAELARAKAYLKARHLEQRQQLRDRALGLAWAETMGLSADFDRDYDQAIDGVTLEAVNRMAQRVLGAGQAVIRTLPVAAR